MVYTEHELIKTQQEGQREPRKHTILNSYRGKQTSSQKQHDQSTKRKTTRIWKKGEANTDKIQRKAR